MCRDDSDEAGMKLWLETALSALCGMAGAGATRPDFADIAGLTGQLIELPPGAHVEFEIALRRRRVTFD